MINCFSIQTPLGKMLAAADKEGLCYLEFADQDTELHYEEMSKIFHQDIIEEPSIHLTQLEAELVEYFKGSRKEFTVKLSLYGTDFQKLVWNALLQIPFGKTRSYKQQSIELKNPLAIRAIAHANGTNRIAIVIPCHRVIGDNGSMTGYAGGIWRKKWLLNHESQSQQSTLDFSPLRH